MFTIQVGGTNLTNCTFAGKPMTKQHDGTWLYMVSKP